MGVFFYLTSFESNYKMFYHCKMMRAQEERIYFILPSSMWRIWGHREERYYTDYRKILLRHL